MDTLEKKSSLFASDTLDSMAQAEVCGGAEGATYKTCPRYTYCDGAKCVAGCGCGVIDGPIITNPCGATNPCDVVTPTNPRDVVITTNPRAVDTPANLCAVDTPANLIGGTIRIMV